MVVFRGQERQLLMGKRYSDGGQGVMAKVNDDLIIFFYALVSIGRPSGSVRVGSGFPPRIVKSGQIGVTRLAARYRMMVFRGQERHLLMGKRYSDGGQGVMAKVNDDLKIIFLCSGLHL